jgi:tetratricopeptide (TPR) repeat protein
MVEAVSQPSAAPVAGRRPRSWGTVAVVAILLAAGAAAYSNSFRGPFILDDLKLIPDNPALRGDWSPWHLAFSSNFRTRPVIALTVAMNYALGGLDVRGYHAVNLVIHLLAALVLFGVVRRTLRLPALAERFAGASTGLALAVALLWMLHPLQTQSVTYIIQRCESMMGLFYLLTLYAVVRGTTSPRPLGWYAAAVVACAFGIWSKQAAVTAPLIVLLYDRTFLAGSLRESLRRRWRLYAALAATWLWISPYLPLLQKWMTVVATHQADPGLPKSTPWSYLATQFGVVTHYLRLTVWPDALCLDYGWPLATTVSTILPPALLILGLLGLTGWALVRRPAAGFAGAAFFIILAPTSSVLPLDDLAFEHRMYLSLALAVVLAVMLGHTVRIRLTSRSPQWVRWAVPAVAVGLAAGILGVRTYVRNDDYRTALSIWEATARACPGNARAHTNLGVYRMAAYTLSGNPADLDEAMRRHREALRLKPDSAEVHCDLAAALVKQGQTDEAIAHYQEALRLKPDYADAHSNLGVALVKQGQTEEAIRHYEEALRLKPDFAEAHYNLGIALYDQGQTDEAIRQYEEALRLRPDHAEARYTLAIALYKRGRTDESIRQYQEAVRIKPDHAEAHCNLGAALMVRGITDDAVAHYRQALQANPDLLPAVRSLAWIMATDSDPKRRNGPEALRLAEHGCRLTGRKDPAFLDALAAAYAEAGRFQEAAAAAREAEALAWSLGNRQMSAQIQTRLRLYEAGRPYRVQRPAPSQ